MKTYKAAREAGLKTAEELHRKGTQLAPRRGERGKQIKSKEFFRRDQCEQIFSQGYGKKQGLRLDADAEAVTSYSGQYSTYDVFRRSDFREIPKDQLARNRERGRRAAETRARNKEVAEERERQEVLARGLIPGSRTADKLLHGLLSEEKASYITFVCRLRHKHSTYDERIEQVAATVNWDQLSYDERQWESASLKEEARSNMTIKIPKFDNWEHYLAHWDFPYAARAAKVASVLQDANSAHPKWFARAVCACEWLNLEPNTYEQIQAAIAEFLDE